MREKLATIAVSLVFAASAFAGQTFRGKVVFTDDVRYDTGAKWYISGTQVSASAAELNVMDGVTATAAEINVLDADVGFADMQISSGEALDINFPASTNSEVGSILVKNVSTAPTLGTSYQRLELLNGLNTGGAAVVYAYIDVLYVDNTNSTEDATIQIGHEVGGTAREWQLTSTAFLPPVDDTFSLGATGTEWDNLWVDGTANIDDLVADTADINAGTVDATLGGTTPAAAAVTTMSVSSTLTVADTNAPLTNTVTMVNAPAVVSSDSPVWVKVTIGGNIYMMPAFELND